MIGFIGLGIMGTPMATNLCKANVGVMVYDLRQEAVDVLVEVGAVQGNPMEIAQSCDLIFTILPHGNIVDDILFGADGIAKLMRPDSLVVDMSSVTPTQSQSFSARLAAYGIRFLDAPVSGGEPGAINATLTFMVGGGQEDFHTAYPYFKIMGSSAVLVGPAGSGSIAKLANQIIVNLNIAAVSEAMVFAAKAGVDPAVVYQAIRGGLAGSAVLDAKAPMMCRRDFTPGGKISINHKDICNVTATAFDLDLNLPFTNALHGVLQSLMDGGMHNYDHSAIVQYFEHLNQVLVRSGNPSETV